MDNAVARKDGGTDVAHYDPEHGLQKIAVADAATKHFRHANDELGRRKLAEAVDLKLKEQAAYIVWRDGEHERQGGDRRSEGFQNRQNEILKLPAADPGDKTAYRWRSRLCKRVKGNSGKKITLIDVEKLVAAISEAQLRCQHVCEQEPNSGELVQQSKSNEHYTPRKYIAAAREVLGAIDLDPASCEEANAIVGAARYYTVRDSGLNHEWGGRVWLNPPYGKRAGAFITKFAEDFDAKHITAGIILANAHCTDTEWFQLLWNGVLCFTDHRINFYGDDKRSGSTHGSVFAYFGPKRKTFAAVFSQFGAIVRRFP